MRKTLRQLFFTQSLWKKSLRSLNEIRHLISIFDWEKLAPGNLSLFEISLLIKELNSLLSLLELLSLHYPKHLINCTSIQDILTKHLALAQLINHPRPILLIQLCNFRPRASDLALEIDTWKSTNIRIITALFKVPDEHPEVVLVGWNEIPERWKTKRVNFKLANDIPFNQFNSSQRSRSFHRKSHFVIFRNNDHKLIHPKNQPSCPDCRLHHQLLEYFLCPLSQLSTYSSEEETLSLIESFLNNPFAYHFKPSIKCKILADDISPLLNLPPDARLTDILIKLFGGNLDALNRYHFLESSHLHESAFNFTHLTIRPNNYPILSQNHFFTAFDDKTQIVIDDLWPNHKSLFNQIISASPNLGEDLWISTSDNKDIIIHCGFARRFLDIRKSAIFDTHLIDEFDTFLVRFIHSANKNKRYTLYNITRSFKLKSCYFDDVRRIFFCNYPKLFSPDKYCEHLCFKFVQVC